MTAATTATMIGQHDQVRPEPVRCRRCRLLDRLAGSSFGTRADDADEDDERDAVADPVLGDLLAQPHDEDRAGRLGHDGARRPEARTRRDRDDRGRRQVLEEDRCSRTTAGCESSTVP